MRYKMALLGIAVASLANAQQKTEQNEQQTEVIQVWSDSLDVSA